MQLQTVSFYDLPRNQLPSDGTCPVCLENVGKDEGKSWVAHQDVANRDQIKRTNLVHPIHKDCAKRAHSISKACLFKDVNLDTSSLASWRERLGLTALRISDSIPFTVKVATIFAVVQVVSIVIGGAVGVVIVDALRGRVVERAVRAHSEINREVVMGVAERVEGVGRAALAVGERVFSAAVNVVGVAAERALETGRVIFEVESKAIDTIINFTANMITNFANRLIG